MSHDNPMTASGLSRTEVVIGTLFGIALFSWVTYLVAQSYPVTLPALSWAIVFTVVLTVRFLWVVRREPPMRKRYIPGEMTINTSIIILFIVFALSFPGRTDFLQVAMANLWPAVLGSAAAFLISQVYCSVQAFRH